MMSTMRRNGPEGSRAAMAAPFALAAACGLAAPAAAQLTEPFPAVFDVESLHAAAGGDGSLGFVVGPESGHSVSRAGDVNGDGIDDIIIGAPRHSGPSLSWVIFGRAGGGFPPEIDAMALDGSDGFRMVGDGGEIGFSVSGAGDVNGDGIDDVLIAGTRGEAFVVFGRRTGFPAELELAALDGTDGFRVRTHSGSIAATGAAGDVNGDGVDDIVIGVAGDLITSGGGQAYVIFGRAGGFPALVDVVHLNGENGFKLVGSLSSRLGVAVAGAGDINGDGIDDVILGAPGMYDEYTMGYGCGCFDPGKAYVVFGRQEFPPEIDVTTLRGHDGFQVSGFDESFAGASVASAGDFNNDGLSDVLVSAGAAHLVAIIWGRDTTGGAAFPASIGLRNLDPTEGLRLEGPSGVSVAGCGDVNGDGIDDVVLGSPYSLPGGADRGSYVVFGTSSPPASIVLPDLDGEDGFLVAGAGGGGWVFGVNSNGEGVSSAGDVNGDGVADLLIARPQLGSPGGATYVVFGRMPDAPCYADCDGSGELDFFDFLCFQNLFAAGAPEADCDGSGELDFFDFLCFQNAFAAGCP